MNKKVKAITADAVFVALLIVLIIVFKYLISVLDTMLPVIISCLIGIRYHKDRLLRVATVSLATLAISFIIPDFYSILVYILPGLILGIISHYLIRIVLNLPYYSLTIFIYFVVDSLIELMYSRLILGLSFNDYLLSGMDFPESFTSGIGTKGLLIFFFGYNLFMAVLEAVILRLGVFMYEGLLIKTKKKNHI